MVATPWLWHVPHALTAVKEGEDVVARVSEEGPFSQSRELLGRTPAPVRIALRGLQTYYVSSGASFADTIIRDFFGYQPDFLTGNEISTPQPRGFDGQLLGVRDGSTVLQISSTVKGIETVPVESHQ
jgi:hypothetical protein